MDLGWGGGALRGGVGFLVLGGADGGTLEFPCPWAITVPQWGKIMEIN
jgi:hypothetical protein